MFTFKLKADAWRLLATILVMLLLSSVVTPAANAAGRQPNLGRVLTPAELASFDTHVFADGKGLPAGTGESAAGKVLYRSHCAACHGNSGQGGSAMELVGDRSLLNTEFPDRGIGVYWPYAPTLFEYIKRSMPPNKPYSLSNDEVYAVIARLLELNQLIDSDQVVNAELLRKLAMPNRDNFRSKYPNSN